MERARQPIEVALVERGEVIHDAQKVVGQVEDDVLDEALGNLLLDDRELILHLDGRIRAFRVQHDELGALDVHVLEGEALGRHLLAAGELRARQMVEYKCLSLVEESEHCHDGAVPTIGGRGALSLVAIAYQARCCP